MKNRLSGLMAMSALALGLATMPSLASAQTAPASTTTNPSGPTTSCGTLPCTGTTLWTVGGQAANAGIGESVFTGATGTNKVEKKGWSIVDITMNGEGCADLNCAQGASSFSAMLKAGEEVRTETTAAGNTSGTAVRAENMSQAIGIGMLQIQRLQGPAQTTSGN